MGERAVSLGLLLDTHVLARWLLEPERLSKPHSVALDRLRPDQKVAISDVTLWELAMMMVRGRVQLPGEPDIWLAQVEVHPQIRVIPITARIAHESVRLGSDFPRDPADRLIVATALSLGLLLLTMDGDIRRWGKVSLL